jgi:hypothetical protein
MNTSWMRWATMSASALSLCALVRAADGTPPERLSNGHSFEGTWVRIDTAGSESFDKLTSGFEKPQYTAAGQARQEEMARARAANRGAPDWSPNAAAPHKPGEPYVAVARPCGGFFVDGAQAISPDSGPQHITISKGQVVMAPERGGARVIHIDGRGHPPAANISPRPSGHSIGHFENGVLLTDVVGLPAGSGLAGAIRTPATRLNERFELSPDGQRLTITYTYSDPDLYVKPFTYALQFDRQPKPSFALDEWCDAGDPKERLSITPPEQE